MSERSLKNLILSLAILAGLAIWIGEARGDTVAATSAVPAIHLIGLSLASSSASSSVNSTSRSIVQSLPAGDFQATLTTVFSTIQGALLPQLSGQSKTPSLNVELRTVGVGVGLTGSIGLGPIFQISLSPKLVLVFSNSKTPVYPD